MTYCKDKNKRYWSKMQTEWIEQIKNYADEDFDTFEKYNFENEWTVSDYEQAPLCQIIWGMIITDFFGKKWGCEKFNFKINRYYTMISSGEREFKVLFDVMNNPKYNIGKSDGYDYHVIGNFAPVFGTSKPIQPSLQFIHRNQDEKWDLFLDYLKRNWGKLYDFADDITFDDYITMSEQTMYLENGKIKEIEDRGQIEEKISSRGIIIRDKFLKLKKNNITESLTSRRCIPS